MKSIEINADVTASVTQMRLGSEFGSSPDELLDGNVLPRLCAFAGSNACAEACRLKLLETAESIPKMCAEENILGALDELYVNPENFAMVSATKDRVGFADQLEALGSSRHKDGYTVVPECNAFFFSPSKDMTHNRFRRLTHVAMRMADCGDVIYTFQDREGDEVLGIAHFSRTNMRGPSAYMHELDGRQVSWGEYVLGSAIDHYGADPASVKVKLVAAVEGKNFIHHYNDDAQMEAHFPGWNELGFMHPAEAKDFDCLIDYREMIRWQLLDSIQNPAHKLTAEQIDTTGPIDTGNLTLGHASHHAATHEKIAHGRDMYILGLSPKNTLSSRIDEVTRLQQGRSWALGTFWEMSDEDRDSFTELYRKGSRELDRLTEVQNNLHQG